MNALRDVLPVNNERAGLRLEDAGFGATLAGMALAAPLVAIAPVFEQGGSLLSWVDACVTLVTVAVPVAAAAIGAG